MISVWLWLVMFADYDCYGWYCCYDFTLMLNDVLNTIAVWKTNHILSKNVSAGLSFRRTVIGLGRNLDFFQWILSQNLNIAMGMPDQFESSSTLQ